MNKFEHYLPSESAENVGKRIALLRYERGITQAQLADALKISRSLVAAIESGHKNPDLKLWLALALYFNVSTDYIAGTSPSRGVKNFSGCPKLDLDRLNETGKWLMYSFYSTLLTNPEFTNDMHKMI